MQINTIKQKGWNQIHCSLDEDASDWTDNGTFARRTNHSKQRSNWGRDLRKYGEWDHMVVFSTY